MALSLKWLPSFHSNVFSQSSSSCIRSIHSPTRAITGFLAFVSLSPRQRYTFCCEEWIFVAFCNKKNNFLIFKYLRLAYIYLQRQKYVCQAYIFMQHETRTRGQNNAYLCIVQRRVRTNREQKHYLLTSKKLRL